MSFLTPLFLLLGLLAAPIIVMYMLRLRRREVLVSSTLLWQKLLRDREANAPWQRLRRNLLLILQLLILAALVLALARPFIPVPSVAGGSVVVLLDGSASMLATDVEPTRFDAARAEVGRWVDDLGGNDRMTLILVGQTPAVLASATNDGRQLHAALEAAEPDPAPAGWPAALALASGAAQGFRDARIVVVSDGGLPDDLPPLPAEAVYVPIGNAGENLALTALATRSAGDGPRLFLSVANTGAGEQEALVSVELDGTLYDSRRVAVPAGGDRNLTWDLPQETATVSARLSQQTADYFPLDDRAWAVHEGGVRNRALLVTPGNIFLEQAYSVLPGVETFKAPPETDLLAGEEAESFDLFIFDSAPLPETLPAGDMLIINPPASPASPELPFTVTGAFSNTTVTRLADSPLLQFVDWSGIDVRQAQAVSAPWAQTLVAAEGGPLLLAGEQSGYRIVILPFDLHDSDLPLQIAFPVLVANITSWLSPGRAFDAPGSLQPGEPVQIAPGASTTAVLVEKPDGATWTEPVGEGSLLFAETGQLGLYRVALRDASGEQMAGTFAVNLFSSLESEIRPAPAIRLGQTAVEAPDEADVGQRELWPWLVAAAFVILAVEWWVHFRGARLPQFSLRRKA
ncbi:MAG: VWA domain-containing protein [Candidatus Promineifilaceae bacterium]|nr:VWA domain-containing protein [Candidatus Promineifilaceae bacterium]